MARYDSHDPEEPGQYPAPAFVLMGLPVQGMGSGAPGSDTGDEVLDEGGTLVKGQYPLRETFSGVPLGGTGAPGTPGIQGMVEGPDEVEVSKATHFKSEHEILDNPDGWDMDGSYGNKTYTAHISVTHGTGANLSDYGGGGGQWDLPGIKGNTPAPGSDQFQTGPANHVMYGGFLKGQRPSQKQHPGFSGPGT